MSWVWLLLAAVLISSACIDLMTYRIPNAATLALLGLFLLTALSHSSQVDWLSHLGAFLLVLVAGFGLFAFGQVGAGDVKILATLALWSGLPALGWLLLWVSAAAFAGMVLVLLLRRVIWLLQSRHVIAKAAALPPVLRRGKGIPYAIGIAPGTIIASFAFPHWLWQ